MFKSKNSNAEIFELSEKEYDRLLKRMSGFFKSHSHAIPKSLVDQALTFLPDMMSRHIKDEYINLTKLSKNPIILEHMEEIIDLRKINGYGSTKIVNTIKEKYSEDNKLWAKFTRSAMDGFLKKYNEMVNNNG